MKDARDRRPSKTETRAQAIEFLERELASFEEYHRQKESISWTALAILFAYAVGVMTLGLQSSVSGTPASCKQTAVNLIISFFVFCAIGIFIQGQLKWKAWELSAILAAKSLLAGIISGATDSSLLNFKPSYDLPFVPTCVREKMCDPHEHIDKKADAFVWTVIAILYIGIVVSFILI